MRLDETLDKVHRKITYDYKEGISKIGREETIKRIENSLSGLTNYPESSENFPTDREIYIEIAYYCLREASKAPEYLGGNEPLGKEAL